MLAKSLSLRTVVGVPDVRRHNPELRFGVSATSRRALIRGALPFIATAATSTRTSAQRPLPITIYSGLPAEDMRAQLDAFERRHGVPVRVWRASGEHILHRAVAEHRAGRYGVDLFETSAVELEALRRENLVRRIETGAVNGIAPSARPGHGEYIGTRFIVEAIAYNTTLVRSDELPRQWSDLADLRWRDRLGIASDAATWLAALARVRGVEATLELMSSVVAVNGISVRHGHSLLANLVAAGEVHLALTVYDYRIRQLKRSGAPVEPLYLDPTPVGTAGLALAARAPNPEGAALFLDFALTEGLSILAERGHQTTAVAQDLPAGLRPAPVDVVEAVSNGALWDRRFEAILARRQR